ncbi:hypothetical protein DPV69_02795 [Pedobacter chitinilyticus]|uniref:Uncharacterized protein n=1 Tax=Pedobacter chitinilyticus TaxID=2233776 RepID=A0A3S3PIF7_9SPHI|nr:hypothetical protein DPV69_02795 [Pedobacter chitinilyticus]
MVQFNDKTIILLHFRFKQPIVCSSCRVTLSYMPMWLV